MTEQQILNGEAEPGMEKIKEYLRKVKARK
jgi:hypothetical protein